METPQRVAAVSRAARLCRFAADPDGATARDEEVAMLPALLEELRQCAFFEQFPPRHQEKLAAMAAEIFVPGGEIIFREGQHSNRLYVLVSGRVALEAEYAGRMFRLQTLYPGDEMGWSAVLHRKMQAQARALEPVRALVFDADEIRAACQHDAVFGRAFFEKLLAAMSERLRTTRVQLLEALAQEDAPEVRL